jgi:hypothetical protein
LISDAWYVIAATRHIDIADYIFSPLLILHSFHYY